MSNLFNATKLLGPQFDHLNTRDSIIAALESPAFEAKYGKLLREKHGFAQTASDNAARHKAQYESGTHQIGALDGNFVPRGFESTPFDQTTTVARGEQQRQSDPRTVAGLDTESAQTGFKGTKPNAFGEVKTERARDLVPLFVDLAKKMARLTAAARKGGVRRIKPTVKSVQGIYGIRGQDAAAKRVAFDSAKRSDAEYLAAREKLSEQTGAALPDDRWYMDQSLGLFRPVRG